MSNSHPPYYLRKLSIAISLGHDKEINVYSREHPWYPVWDLVMNRYFLTTALHIGPQWPLWRLQIPGQGDPDEESKNQLSTQQQTELQRTILAREASNQTYDSGADNDGNDDDSNPSKTNNNNSGTSDGGSGTNNNDSSDSDRAAAADVDNETSSSEDSQDDIYGGDEDDEQAVSTSVISRMKSNQTIRQIRQKTLAASSLVAKPRQPVPDRNTLVPVIHSNSSMLPSQRTGSARNFKETTASISRTAVKGKQAIRTDHNPYEHAAAEKQTEASHRQPPRQSHIAYDVLSDIEQGPSKSMVKGSKTSSHSATHKVQSNKRLFVPTSVRQHRIRDEEESGTESTEENIVSVKPKAQVHHEKQSTQTTVHHRRDESYSPEEWEDDSAGGEPVPVKHLNSSNPSEAHSGDVTDESSNSTSSYPKAAISWKDSFRIPDFALLRVDVIGVVPIIDMVRQTAHLRKAQVVLLLEVKRLSAEDDATQIDRQLKAAKDCLKIQAAYVFSRSQQTSVQAVAIAGHYFQLATIRRNSSKPRSTQSEIADPTWASSGRANQALLPIKEWTKALSIGSKEAFPVWNKLRQNLTTGI